MTRDPLDAFKRTSRADFNAFKRDIISAWCGALAVEAVVILGGVYLVMHYVR